MKKFIEFIREQGVVGLAVGFILGGAVSKMVSSIVADIINPIIGIFIGAVGNLSTAKTNILGSDIMWGNFVTTFIDFVIIAFVVYYGVKIIGVDKLDKKKE